MEAATSKFDKEKLGERIAALSGGIARIMVSTVQGDYMFEQTWKGEVHEALLISVLVDLTVPHVSHQASLVCKLCADWRIHGDRTEGEEATL